MIPERSKLLLFVLAASILTINIEVAAQSGLLSIERCKDTKTTGQFFACKIDECQEWMTFTKCPDGSVSSGMLNLQKLCMICIEPTLTVNSTDQGLLPRSKCTNSFENNEIFWCSYENCWFAFFGCDENETQTEYLNLNTKKFHCLPKQTRTENLHILTEPPILNLQLSTFSGDISLEKSFIIFIFVFLMHCFLL